MDESELEVKGSSDSKQSGDATPGQKRPRDGEPPAEVTRDSKYMSGVTSAQSSAVSSASSSVSKATLELYYSRLFPVSQMFAWISYGTNDPAVAAKREYCITMRTQEKDEVFVRYSCCPTKEALRNLLRRDSLVDFVTKLDIGPIYNTDVTNHKSGVQFYPEEKELVFDIDMDAYDGVRTCCKGKHVCPKCWKFLTCALKVLNRALREDFGFKHILFVYSGRRGIHCWVCDKKARSLTNHGREAVASYLAVNVNSLILPLVKDSTAIDDNGRPEQVPQNTFNHPSLVRAMAILKPIMNSLLDEQGILKESTSAVERQYLIKRFCPLREADAQQQLLACIQDSSNGNDGTRPSWDDFVAKVAGKSNARPFSKGDLMHYIRKMAFYYGYPRLDIEVSKQTNHLLKAPFCIHPATGRVCVPIDPNDADTFDPSTVPTLDQLLREVNDAAKKAVVSTTDAGSASSTSALAFTADKTSLRQYIEFFSSFVSDLLTDERAKGKRVDADMY